MSRMQTCHPRFFLSLSFSATMTTGNGGGGGGAKQGGRGEVSWRAKKSCNLIAHTHSTTDGNGKQKNRRRSDA